MSYTADDFRLLPWNPLTERKGIIDKWAPFKQYNEFKEKLSVDKDKFLNFMCLSYHKRSVLHEDYPDANDRSRVAAKIAGWQPKSGNFFVPEIEDILNCKNTIANKMIVRFCILQNDLEYGAMVSTTLAMTRLMFDTQNVAASDASVSERQVDISKMFKSIKDILRELDEAKERIFYNKELGEEINAELMSHERIPGFPEIRAKLKQEKQQNVLKS